MSANDNARAMLEMAEKDLRALKGMNDPDVFAEQIFGFHAQQAIEKTLKAWIASLDLEFPLTHNIARLLAILEENNCDVEAFWELVEYTVYAVAFRYDANEMIGELLNRQDTLNRVEILYNKVNILLK